MEDCGGTRRLKAAKLPSLARRCLHPGRADFSRKAQTENTNVAPGARGAFQSLRRTAFESWVKAAVDHSSHPRGAVLASGQGCRDQTVCLAFWKYSGPVQGLHPVLGVRKNARRLGVAALLIPDGFS